MAGVFVARLATVPAGHGWPKNWPACQKPPGSSALTRRCRCIEMWCCLGLIVESGWGLRARVCPNHIGGSRRMQQLFPHFAEVLVVAARKSRVDRFWRVGLEPQMHTDTHGSNQWVPICVHPCASVVSRLPKPVVRHAPFTPARVAPQLRAGHEEDPPALQPDFRAGSAVGLFE